MRPFAVCFTLLAIVSSGAAKDKFETADFVQQQLNSIGTNENRAAVKDRVVQGSVTFEILNRGPVTWQGPATMVSEGDELATQFKFPPTVYRTEWFVSDGKKASTAPVRPGRWTEFGDFVRTHNQILTEGLWGGTMSTAWALAHLDERRAKLEDRGMKKIDGVELHRVDYIPRKNGDDLEIQLYFEPDSYRHVMTVYLMTVVAPQGYTANESGAQSNRVYRLEERFGDFKTIDNVSLPMHWKIRFTYGAVSEGLIDQYDVTEAKIVQNIAVDPKNFEMK
ncbi:MAG TPA: hypothetical protein VGG14_01240 [Candidatus Sulfotelmatobacter sp.]